MTEEIRCVVDGCEWTMDITPPEVSPMALAGIFGVGVFASTSASQHAQHIERVLETHYSSHTLPEFLRTIVRLQTELREWRGNA